MIDFILALIFGIIALVALTLIPSNEKIRNNETQRYKSSKVFIHIAGAGALLIGILSLIFYMTDENAQGLWDILKIPLFAGLGIALIARNAKKSKFMASCEAGGAVVGAQTMGVEVMAQPQYAAAPVPGQQIGIKGPAQVPVQQVGIKGQPVQPVQAQPQMQAQQVGIKGQPVQAQVQRVPVTAQPQVQPQVQPQAQQPRIIVIKCPRCKGNMQINTAMLGQKMKCPHCGVEGKIG